MNDKQIDELIDKALREEQVLPKGISGRLEAKIDSWAASEKKKNRSLNRRHGLYWLSGIAAAALICIGIFGSDHPIPDPEHKLADTYTDPKEASIAAQKALLLLSQNLNKGIDQAKEAQEEINKVNSILNEHINY